MFFSKSFSLFHRNLEKRVGGGGKGRKLRKGKERKGKRKERKKKNLSLVLQITLVSNQGNDNPFVGILSVMRGEKKKEKGKLSDQRGGDKKKKKKKKRKTCNPPTRWSSAQKFLS